MVGVVFRSTHSYTNVNNVICCSILKSFRCITRYIAPLPPPLCLCLCLCLCIYLSVSLCSLCLFLSLAVTFCLFLSLSVSFCLFLSLSVSLCLYQSRQPFHEQGLLDIDDVKTNPLQCIQFFTAILRHI